MPTFLNKDFKKLLSSFDWVEKHASSFCVNIPTYSTEVSEIEFAGFAFKSLDSLYQVIKASRISAGSKFTVEGVANDFLEQLQESIRTYTKLTAQYLSNVKDGSVKGLKIIPDTIARNYLPKVILNAPLEYTTGVHTYRFVTTSPINAGGALDIVAREDDPLYDYLDVGHFIMRAASPEGRLYDNIVVADAYDLDTAHIFMMCQLQPTLTGYLKNGCFINSREAEMLRLKLFKKLTNENREIYHKDCAAIDNDYQKNTTLVVVNKVANGELEYVDVANIRFYTEKAVYENIVVEYPGLLHLLKRQLNFNGEFDIYHICELLGKDRQALMSTDSSLPSFKINNIDISFHINTAGQRFINGVRVNKDEVAAAIRKASCYHDASEYNLFLKSISRLSIKMHDVLAKGLAVKIHDMSSAEYQEEKPSINAPALQFSIDSTSNKYYLKVNETRKVRINLCEFIKRVEYINSKTDNRHYYGNSSNNWRSGRRDNSWAVEQLTRDLIRYCTFKVKEKNSLGETITRNSCSLVRDDVIALFGDATKAKREAIERSKEFMATAVRLTGAEEIEFKGQQAYKVKGNLRTYAIVVSNAKVYDYDTGKYRCIVNSGHYDGAGYDDVASRLLALKNDSVMQSKVTTLIGEAQPQYENAHAHNPEREVPAGVIAGLEALTQ